MKVVRNDTNRSELHSQRRDGQQTTLGESLLQFGSEYFYIGVSPLQMQRLKYNNKFNFTCRSKGKVVPLLN
jgi:hypothetical protein